jgi:hypothetical protein
MAECVYCGCPRLGAAEEPVKLGDYVGCPGCGSLMVVDVDDDGKGIVREMDNREQLASLSDRKAQLLRVAYAEAAPTPKALKKLGKIPLGKQLPPLTIKGPDAR